MEFKVIRMHRIDGESNLKGFADISIDESLLLKGLRVVQGKNNLFIAMPREKGRDGRWYEMIHPITKEIKEAISSVVLTAYNAQ